MARDQAWVARAGTILKSPVIKTKDTGTKPRDPGTKPRDPRTIPRNQETMLGCWVLVRVVRPSYHVT